MNAITVRNLPPAVAKAVREKARKEKLSLNKAIVKLLEEATATGSAQEEDRPPRPRPVLRDLERGGGRCLRPGPAGATPDRSRDVGLSRLLLDTSAYSAMRRGDQRLLQPLREASEVLLSSVVLGELLYGFVGGKLESKNRDLLRDFLDSERVDVVPVDEDTAERYAAIRNHLRGQGRPIPTNDLWIAASAAQHGLVLLTLDHHFTDVPHILVEYFEPAS